MADTAKMEKSVPVDDYSCMQCEPQYLELIQWVGMQ